MLAAAALALYAALQAVDGVALKHAVDAWAVAAGPEKSMRFATAEGIRWIEWGMRSYQSFLLGAALILAGLVIVLARGISRGIGILMGLSGLAYVAQGWVIGAEGFSAANAVPTLSGIVLTVVWTRLAAHQCLADEGGADPAAQVMDRGRSALMAGKRDQRAGATPPQFAPARGSRQECEHGAH